MSAIEDVRRFADAVAAVIKSIDGYAGKLHGADAHLDAALGALNDTIKSLGGTPVDHPSPTSL